MKKHEIVTVTGFGRDEKKRTQCYWTEKLRYFPFIDSKYGTYIQQERVGAAIDGKVEAELTIRLDPPRHTPLIDMRVVQEDVQLLVDAWCREHKHEYHDFITDFRDTFKRNGSTAMMVFVVIIRARVTIDVPQAPAFDSESWRVWEALND